MRTALLPRRCAALLVALAAAGGAVACTPTRTAAPTEDAGADADTGSAAARAAPANETLEQRARRIHDDAIVIDTHNDIPSVMLATGVDLGDDRAKDTLPNLHTDLARMRAGGITGEFFSIYVDKGLVETASASTGGPARRALDLIDVVYQQVERHPESLVLATRAADIRRAKQEKKIACLMGIEGGHAIENSLAALRDFHRLGVRYMTLTHTNTNDWADSAGFSGPPVVRHHGLSPFGERVVAEMQRIGMLVDVSHVSDETFEDVLAIAKAPVIASHSSTRALAKHRRNLSDAMLRALAKNGGVVMINFWSAFLDDAYATANNAFYESHAEELDALRARYRESDPRRYLAEVDRRRRAASLPRPPFSILVDHIEHAMKVAGPDHVGLGSDFDGVDSLPEGMDGIQDLPKITLELLRRGHSEAEVRKVLGENFLRVFEAAEAFARSAEGHVSGAGDTTKLAPTPDGGVK